MDNNQNEMNVNAKEANPVERPKEESWKAAFAENAEFATANGATVNTGTPFSVPTGTAWKSRREDTEALQKMKEKFSFFGPATLAYAVFYAFCMFQNDAGIAFLFFIIATQVYLCVALKQLDMKLKKGSAFYLTAMLLLAVSTFCTDDAGIIIFNKTGIFLLAISLLLKNFYQTNEWGLGKYLQSILLSGVGCLEELERPFTDTAEHMKKGGKDGKNLGYVLLGLVISFPVLAVVIGLLADADVFFRQIAYDVVDVINAESIVWVMSRILLVFLFTYILIARLCRHSLSESVTDHRNGEPVLAITVTGLLTLVYLLFSGIQIFGLFLGQMQLPQGYTYAEYAREGFFQLLAVSIINLVLVLSVMSFFKESKVLKGILTLMSLCTFVMIASSVMRMLMYIQNYDLTYLRILVLWTLGLLTFLFVGVLISIYSRKFPMFRYSMVVVTILYLGLSFGHPDYLIASVNVRKQTVDYKYLERLSADAAPVLIPYIQQSGTVKIYREEDGKVWFDSTGDSSERTAPISFGLGYLDKLVEEKMDSGIRTFNVSRYIAAEQCRGFE